MTSLKAVSTSKCSNAIAKCEISVGSTMSRAVRSFVGRQGHTPRRKHVAIKGETLIRVDEHVERRKHGKEQVEAEFTMPEGVKKHSAHMPIEETRPDLAWIGSRGYEATPSEVPINQEEARVAEDHDKREALTQIRDECRGLEHELWDGEHGTLLVSNQAPRA
jgi:hypothetical protein